ncbi:hypothetical protein QBC39DRAFT_92633 [Podospora conica]|nr:hypothetical protein QBC39DRAFT_92633 [Schizothecium conicum]
MDPTSIHEHDLGGSYRQYKIREHKFTSWLQEAAAKVNPRPREDPRQGQGYTLRLERMAQVVADRSSIGEIPQDPINMLRDVVKLRKGCAEFYRAAAVKVKNGLLAKANATHNHMILVLEKVLGLLEAKVCRRPKSPLSTTKPFPEKIQVQQSANTLATESLGTMFANLEVFPVGHDTSEHSEGEVEPANPPWKTQTAGRPRKRKSKKCNAQQAKPPTDDSEWDRDKHDKDTIEEDEFDVYMVIYCLFEDFNKIRDHVLEKWCDSYYHDTTIKLSTLGAITNAAFEMFHRMQEELEHHPASASPNTNFQSFTWIIGTLLASEMNEGESFVSIEESNYFPQLSHRYGKHGPARLKVCVCATDRVSGEARQTIKECDFTEDQNYRLALRPWALMRTFFKGRAIDDIPTLCPDHGNWKFTYLYKCNDPTTTFDVDWFATQDFSQDLSLLRLLKTRGHLDYLLPAEPELNLDFQDAFRRLRRKGYPIHDSVAFLFSLQLFVDIRRVLEDRVMTAFDLMNGEAHRVHAALVRHLNHIQPDPTHPGHPDKQNLIRLITRRIYELNAYVLRDPIHHPDDEHTESPHRFHLLERDPVWAGLLYLRVGLVSAKLGREACEMPGGLAIVEAGACLYAATVSVAGAAGLVPYWEEMEKWIGGGRSHVKADTLHFWGESGAVRVLEDFQKANNKGFERPTHGRRGLEVMWERYGETFRDGKRHLGYLEELVELPGGVKKTGSRDESSETESSEGDSWSNVSGGSDNVATGKSKADATPAANPRSVETTGKGTQLSPIEMLEVLEKRLESGLDGELDVNYLGLFDLSVRMLKALVKSKMGKKYGLRAAWTDKDDVEGLVATLSPLTQAAKVPKQQRQVIHGMARIVLATLEDAFFEEGDFMDEISTKCPKHYDEEYPGRLPPRTAVTVRRTGRWAMGWGEEKGKVTTRIGPQPDGVAIDNKWQDKVWSTHELSEKYDRFMEPLKM